MSHPRASDAVKTVAERHGVCVRPIAIRRINTSTGQTSIIEVPCGATLASKCKPCAERGRRLRIQQIREGWHLTEEPAVPVDEDPEALVFCGPTGGPIWRGNFNKLVNWAAAVESIGRPRPALS
jgi:hypothetical protein